MGNGNLRRAAHIALVRFLISAESSSQLENSVCLALSGIGFEMSWYLRELWDGARNSAVRHEPLEWTFAATTPVPDWPPVFQRMERSALGNCQLSMPALAMV